MTTGQDGGGWLEGGGALGAAVRARDWSRTPLGTLDAWPEGLCTAVSLCLGASPPSALVWGPAYTLLYNEPCRHLLGPRHPEALGLDAREAWAFAGPELAEALERARAGESFRLEHQRLSLDAEGLPGEALFSVSVSPVRARTGEVAGVFLTMTESVHAGDPAYPWREAVAARDDVLARVGQELKKPLDVIELNMELIERDLSPQSRLHVFGRLVVASRQVQRLRALMETLVDVSSLSAGQMALRYEDLMLSTVVQDAVNPLEGDLTQAGIALHVECMEDTRGEFDRQRLAQAVAHLLRNAVRYSQGRSIEVYAGSHGEWGYITVVDHGQGISAEDRERLFERFEHVAPLAAGGGLGLGLWLTRRIVETHAGRITLSDTPGGGATFTIEVPLIAPPE